MELILLRHGVIRGNKEYRFIGTTDQPLTAEGEEMARRRGAVIPTAEHVFVSPLVRCLRTAELVWPGAARTILPDLRETDFGRYEGRSSVELQEDKDYLAWLAAGCTTDMPTVETRAQCVARAGLALQEILRISKEKNLDRVGVVTHGGTIMALLSGFGRPERAYRDWLTPNCGGWVVRAMEDGPVLEVLAPLEELH